jgi:hypothetical protein
MRVLLFILSFGWVLALIVSATVVLVWAARRLLDSLVQTYLEISRPELRAAKKKPPEINPHQWKRAGQ